MTTASVAPTRPSSFTGTWSLVRVALRRSRLMITAWLGVFVGMAALSSSATVDLYPDVASRLAAAESLNNSQAIVALYGRVYDPSSIGAISMIKMGGLGSVFVAMLAVVLVTRHTRGDEEAGRLELVAATAMGRRAPLTAAFVVVALTSVVLAVLTAAALAATGLPVTGSIAFGLAWGGVVLSFGAIAGVAAQLTTSSRAATALSATILAVVYVVRAVGDAANEGAARWLSWLSPFGWAQQFRPFAGNRWWVLGITLGFTAVVAAGAFALAVRRDLGTGLLPTRPGPARAAAWLRSPLALAWRLERATLAGSAVAVFLLGALMGNLATNVGDFVTSDAAREFFEKLGGEKALTDAFFAVEFAFAGIATAAYGMHVIMRLHAEESGQRAEPVLATAVSRLRWAGSQIVVAVSGTTLLLVLTGAGAALAYGATAGSFADVGRVFAAALVPLPAALVMIALVVAIYGFAPRFTTAGWGLLAVCLLIAELGPLLELSHWVMDLSPFVHVPRLPGDAFRALPLVMLAVVASAVTAAGLAAFRRRDVT